MIDYGLGGRAAIVTGAGSGIGRESALRLAGQGVMTALIGNVQKDLEDAANEITENGGTALAALCDVSDDAAVHAAVERVAASFGRLDILVNCAGIEVERDEPGQFGSSMLTLTSPEEYQRVIGVNLVGHYSTMRAAVPHMQKGGFGRIVNISSVTAYNGQVGSAAYVASKAGIIVQSKAFANEFGKDNITVNCIAPGMIDTPMHATTPREMFDMTAKFNPLRRYGFPMDIAKLVLFLTQEELYITGETIVVDGGGRMQ
jgi:3-oxoacyl-[acyl-carrier protein] reductase